MSLSGMRPTRTTPYQYAISDRLKLDIYVRWLPKMRGKGCDIGAGWQRLDYLLSDSATLFNSSNIRQYAKNEMIGLNGLPVGRWRW